MRTIIVLLLNIIALLTLNLLGFDFDHSDGRWFTLGIGSGASIILAIMSDTF